MTRYGAGALAAALLMHAAPAMADEGPYLFSIPAELAANQSLPLGEDIIVTLEVPDADHAAATLVRMAGIDLVATGEGFVTLKMGDRATLPGDPLPAHLEASFVIDFDEPAFEGPLQELKRSRGDTPTTDQLIDFVHGFVSDKNYSRSFDLASRVADSREGDCTEHAVLLAAVSRATGRPARVVAGVLFVSGGDRQLGLGHAWTEIYEDGRWQIADATMPQREAPELRTFYVPMIGLENEGPGYGLDFARIIRLQPSRLSGIAGAR
ncbi:MAG: transglutaminase-like domain-containing protein [Pseudomonadota bacterium]